MAEGRQGGGELVLAELKVISSCPTRYQRNPRATVKAVDRRAATLPGEYARHARNIDREYGGVAQGTVGPVESKLLSFPPLRRWVFGAWGEASEDVHMLVHDLAPTYESVGRKAAVGEEERGGRAGYPHWAGPKMAQP